MKGNQISEQPEHPDRFRSVHASRFRINGTQGAEELTVSKIYRPEI